MIKILLIICIICLTTYIGIKKSRGYEEREEILREAILLFKRVENEIKYNLATLPNAIEVARQTFNTSLKDVLGSISLSYVDTTYSDEKVVGEINTITSLKPYDKQIISNGLISLGAADVDSQINIITNVVNTLSELVGEAKDAKNKNSKLYKTVGLVSGLMIAIVII